MWRRCSPATRPAAWSWEPRCRSSFVFLCARALSALQVVSTAPTPRRELQLPRLAEKARQLLAGPRKARRTRGRKLFRKRRRTKRYGARPRQCFSRSFSCPAVEKLQTALGSWMVSQRPTKIKMLQRLSAKMQQARMTTSRRLRRRCPKQRQPSSGGAQHLSDITCPASCFRSEVFPLGCAHIRLKQCTGCGSKKTRLRSCPPFT
mmetsp:Transcript_6185/g.11602  ORF Transcript_6185/g.11602 Transcript_6185/m.11602 type:complete len:205 (-) Transcript_6185:2423-3037(-)